MSIDIASPGGHAAALRAAIGAQTGLVLLNSGTILAPVDFVEIALPVGYVEFQFKFWGCVSDSVETFADSFAYQLSFDNGDTYIDDGYECYTNAFHAGQLIVEAGLSPTVQTSGPPNSGVINRFIDTDPVAYIADNPSLSKPLYADMTLYPGSSYENPRSISRDYGTCHSFSGSNDYRFQEGTDAALLTMMARANKLKVGYYFGDGYKWAQGAYAMWGVLIG